MLERQDWPLLALHSSSQGRLSPVKMQKALFLFGKGLQDARDHGFYQFEPYHYGPFDQKVYDDLERLEAAGFVRRVESRAYRGRDYELTAQGADRASELSRDVPQRTIDYVSRVVKWIEPLTFTELVAAIYNRFPEFKARSIFRS